MKRIDPALAAQPVGAGLDVLVLQLGHPTHDAALERMPEAAAAVVVDLRDHMAP
jgi:hypothetical protein